MNNDTDAPADFDERLAQRTAMLQKEQRPKSTIEMEPVDPRNQYGGKIPNTPLAVATISFLLGCVFALSFALFVAGGYGQSWWSTWQLGFFVSAWSIFHWGEFAVTAGWNRDKCNVDSFLLDNGVLYHVANGTALTEYLLSLYFKPSWKGHPMVSPAGAILVILGQLIRTVAMIHASTNFSHAVAFRKTESHRLITDGIYSWFRHPSYAGFFYWALGTQVLLQNPLSFFAYLVLLWRFFSQRIKAEETALIRFFGQDYKIYRSKVGTKIPLIT